jgi:uncharacterized repeat protein (TIGR01451 family)
MGGEPGEWFECEPATVELDLVPLQEENAQEIWSGTLPDGDYNKVFVHVTNVTGKKTSGEIIDDIKLPSSKLHINTHFTLPEDSPVHFIFDLTVVAAGNEKSGIKYILKPVVSESGPNQKYKEVNPSKAGADLEIDKTDDLDEISTGENLTYTITIRNNGPHDATSINVTDTLSEKVAYQSANASTGSYSYSASDNVVTWLIDNMDRGASANITITALVIAPGDSGNITNTATIIGAENDRDLENNTATDNNTAVTP